MYRDNRLQYLNSWLFQKCTLLSQLFKVVFNDSRHALFRSEVSYTVICVTRTDDSLLNIKKDFEEFTWKMTNPTLNIEFTGKNCKPFEFFCLSISNNTM